MFAEVTISATLLDRILEYLQGLIWFGFWIGVGAAAVAGVVALIFGMGLGIGIGGRRE